MTRTNLGVSEASIRVRREWRRFELTLIAVLACGAGQARGAEPVVLYRNDFSQADVGSTPEGLRVLSGGFAVREADGNRFLELPGTPLETYGVLFGTIEEQNATTSRSAERHAETANLSVAARVYGTNTGRRCPTFGIGLGGVGGHRLQVSPGKRELELFRGDATKASAPFQWTAGEWLWLKLEVRKTGEREWKVRGKVWQDGTVTPLDWGIEWIDTEPPKPGRASLWGSPFADTPIRFDDVSVERIPQRGG